MSRWSSQNLKQRFGLSQDEYRQIWERQNHRCALADISECKHPSSRAYCVDHDPVTGVVRGILCQKHNTGLGKLGDSVEALGRALDYVTNAKATRVPVPGETASTYYVAKPRADQKRRGGGNKP